ncbi:DevR family CRISPR-associated autoregulator [Desulfothermobacter acidiphilus]|uniref:DevR family CRISPR-associated autoregulator n=1 Tax=Desulfothermobacter acidiphilus TaxID=1938353 RepID=UPI003F8B28C9
MKRPVYSMSISGRIMLNMHSLNNEGGEGIQIATRMVNIVYKDPETGEPRLASVNAVSGDMLKHIQAEHLYLQAKAEGLPLCAGCQKFKPSRALEDGDFVRNLPARDAEVIDSLLQKCVIDDLEGNLIAKGNRSIPRKSVVEFAWVVGVPDLTRTESYFHVRYASERGEEGVTQPIFHRPASSGVYAVVMTLEVARIGFNDIDRKYSIDQDQREKRYKVLLESVLYTFVEPNGAMRNTQNPHILDFQGVVTVSSQVVPAPALSPLSGNYVSDLRKVGDALNGVRPGAIEIYEFNSMADFASVMSELLSNTVPYSLPAQQG